MLTEPGGLKKAMAESHLTVNELMDIAQSEVVKGLVDGGIVTAQRFKIYQMSGEAEIA
jgi:hypothetical protein